MTLRRDSLLIRWAYLLEPKPNGPTVDLCTVFWRALVLTPSLLFLFGIWVALIIVILLVKWWMLFVMVAGIFIGLLVAVAIARVICETRLNAAFVWIGEKLSPKGSAAAEFVRGVKERYCPIVRLEDQTHG